MKRNMTRRKLNTIFLFVIFFTFSFISIGYSALQQELTISGDIAFEHYEPTLYDVLKREAKHNGLAREYTGEHQDSMAGVGTQKIYHWYADNDTDGTAIQDKNNVVFANHCWQMIRTTDTGGVKMIYNGEAVDNQCLNTRGTHVGYASRTSQNLASNYWYGTDYTYDSTNQVFSIAGTTEQATWSEVNASGLIGKYTCKQTTEAGTCATLYLIESYYNTTSAYVIPLNSNSNYSQFGTLQFNASPKSPSYVGYMHNIAYPSQQMYMKNYEYVLVDSSLSTTYWYAHDVMWSNSSYKLVSPYQVNATTDYPNLVGEYTFKNTAQTYLSTVAFYIVAVDNTTMYYMSLANSGDHTFEYFNYTYTYGDSFTDNGNGTYTINNPATIQRKDWYTNYSDVGAGKYVCKNAVNDTCGDLWYTTGTSKTIMTYIKVANNYKYAKGFTWDGSKYVLDNDTSINFWNIKDSTNKTSINNAHYTCWNTTGECESISYIYYIDDTTPYYINITNGKSVEDAVNEMLYDDNVNTTNSTMKSGVDAWYKHYLLEDYDDYIEDTIFCNNRSMRNADTNAWNPNGGSLSTYMYFKEQNATSDLSCTNTTDRFSTTNPSATLTYKVGLMSSPEANILNNKNALKTEQYYWIASPQSFNGNGAYGRYVYKNGGMNAYYITSTYGVRPAISLNPGTEYYAGDGSMANPYIVSDYIHNTKFSESAISGGTKNVTITFPSGCGSTLTCTYKKDNGSDVTVTTSSVVVPFTSAGGLTTAVTKPNGTSLTNSHIVKFNALYVSSSGNDTTGNGSISNPYATLIKAYNMAENTATIYAMNNLTVTDTTTFDKNKNITLTSCTKSADTCPTSNANSVIRGNSFKNKMINLKRGSLALNTIKIDGNNVNATESMIYSKGSLYLNSGANLTKGISSNNGGAVYNDGGTLTVNGATVTSNSADKGGGIYSSGGSMTISSGTISSNAAEENGGGVYALGTVEISGGTISNNTSQVFAGGFLCGGTCTMNGGTITGNTAVTDHGGGLRVEGTLNVIDGTVINNSAPTCTVTNNISVKENVGASFYDSKAEHTHDHSIFYVASALNNNYVLDLSHSEIHGNILIYQNESHNNQKWKTLPAKIENGVVYYAMENLIRNAQDQSQVMAVISDSTVPEYIIGWEFDDYPGRYYRLVKANSPYYYIKNRDLCVSVENGTASNEQRIKTETCNSSTAQKWKFVVS